MKKEGYILGELTKIFGKKKKIDSGYANVLYALYSDFFNFSYTDSSWINKDRLFCDNEEMILAFNKILKIEKNKSYNLPLSAAIGLSMGCNKISGFIKENIKKNNILTYKSYVVCDFEKLTTGDYLNSALYTKDKDIDNLVVVAIKHSEEKNTTIASIYEEMGFDVTNIKNNKIRTITDALKETKKQKNPLLIIVNCVDLEIEKNSEPIDLEIEVRTRTNEVYKKWLLEYDKIIDSREQNTLDIINYLKSLRIAIDLENTEFKLDTNYENTIIKSSDKIFSILLKKSKYITLVNIKDERLASNIACGLSLSGMKPSVPITNFLNVSDIINRCQQYELPVNYLLHDTTSEVYANNLNVFYPSDMHEVIGSWSSIIKQDITSLMILSDKETTLIKNTNLKYVKYGAYMIKKEKEVLNGIIIASGEEVKLALGVAGLLEKENIFMRVVTVPCPNLLLKQVKYEKELLLRSVKIFALDKNLSVINNKFTSSNYCLISSDLGLDKVKERIKEEFYS
ncbi:MAG: hypothetical protein R3Y13_00730 [bacterium]